MPYRSDRKVDHWVGIDGVSKNLLHVKSHADNGPVRYLGP